MMNVLNVLLLCLTAACAVPVHFPAGKTVIYKYYADVKAGVIEPAQYASQFALNGQLHIKKDVSDPALRNAYYVKLQDVKYGMYNGMSAHHQPIEVVHELGEAAQQIQDPFLVVYDRSGKFQGIKVPETESGWSRNIKQGIASMLQLDLSHVQLETPIKPHAFVTTENTIHGTCHVAYDVQPKVPVHPETTNFVVTKLHDLMNCSHFVQRVFDHTECEKCHVEPVDDMTTAARRVFHIEKQDAGILIKHMIAHSVINYFPYNARSEAHYLLTNTTLTLDNVMSTTETHLPVVNFQSIPLVRDVTFNKPVGNYAIHAAEDLTHGRHIVKLDALIPKLKKMLAEAADYLEENHLEAKEPDWKHGQTINRLQHTMSYMDLGSLEQVFTAIQDPKTPKEVTMKNIFLQMIPTVGTTAACHFTRNVVRKHKVTDMTAMTMLAKLPRHVKVPSERLLLEMEDLLKLDNVVSSQVYKASILCFSTLIHRTFMNQSGESVNPLLNRYLHRFFDHVMREPYDMKIVYLMAIKNVQVGNIEKLLEPIIRGEVTVSEHPHHTRVQAIWAIKKAVADKIEYTHNLLWPILADVTQPLPIRIVAYDVLMSQMPNTQRMMSIYWLMVYEQNNHLYNYHLTTLKGLANSVNPCLTPIREMARKFMRYTRIRPITTQLSSKVFFEYIDSLYDHGYSWTSSSVLDEVTGLPHAGYAELHTTVARKVVDRFGIYWNAFGMDEIMKIVKKELMGIKIENLTNKNVLNILSRAALDMPKKNAIHVDICITQHGHVIFAGHYDQTHITKLPEELLPFMKQTFLNYQEITYHTLYEMQVPTDMGLQAVLGTRMPHMLSLRYNDLTDVNSPSPNHKFEFDLRLWRHGEYAMSIYNPIADVWHSIRRSTTRDIAWPLEMNVGFNHEAKSLKINIPRLPVTKLSYSGIRHHAKNLVTITEDEQDVLKECCSTCHHHTVVTTGEKKNYHSAVDSKDTGLKYSTSIFDCDSNVTPVTNAEEWQRAFSPEYKSTWNSKIIQYYMGFIQKLENDYISPEMGSCGRLIKMEPSIIYPTSHVDLTLRVNMDDVDRVNDKMHILSGKKINIRGTLDAKAASTNESVRSWDVNVNMDMSQGHLVNNIRVQVTRVTPGEKKLKICVDVQKNYSETEFPYPKMSNSKVETNTKMTISSGFTDEEKCVRDEMLITMTLKGEMTEQQKSEMAHDHVHGACVKDIANSLFIEKENHVPKTMNCIRETMLYTTLRKYTVNVSYKKIPVSVYSQLSMFDDHFRATHLPHVRYLSERAEGGNAKIVIEFPSDLKYINATVITPVNGYEYIEIPVHQHLFEGMIMGKPTPHWGWHATMDNTHFPISALSKVTQGLTKICTVYPQVLITLDNGVIPFMVPDQWTLVSGDHVDQTYAIFAKAVQGNMIAVKVYIAGHEMEIMPTGSNHVVTVDGNVIVQHEKGVIVPEDEPKFYAFKLAMHNEHLVIHSQRVPVMVLWAPNSVSVMVETVLQGHVTGVCGHMDDMHKERLPKIYSVEHL